MSRRIDLITGDNDKLFKTYNKFSNDHFSNKPRGMKFEQDTYHNYLADALSYLSQFAYFDPLHVKNKKQAKALMQHNYSIVLQSLSASAYGKTTDSWRKLRRSLQVAYKAVGLSDISDEIASMKNPAEISARSQNTKKSKRISKVTDEIYKEFKHALVDKGDAEALQTIEIIRSFGIRPVELINAKLVENNKERGTVTLFIEGAKKTMKGKELRSHKRGIDRTLTVKSNDMLQAAILRIGGYDHNLISAIQERIGKLSRKLRPDSDKHLCFYSFRYTYGSDLKRNLYTIEGGRISSAAIMGHKNTSSISSYGHYKSGTLGANIPQVDAEAKKNVIDNVGKRFDKEGKNFDIGEAIRKREYRCDLPRHVPVNTSPVHTDGGFEHNPATTL